MADQDVIIEIGSSNMAGFLANLYDVTAADYLRWFSQAVPTPSVPARPYVVQAPGVRMWTPRRPYSLNSQRLVTVGGGVSSQFTYGGAAIAAPAASVDMWLFFLIGTGRGNIRRIRQVAGQVITCFVGFGPSVSLGDTVVVLQDSHTIGSVSVDGRILTKVAGTSPNFSAADVGRFVSFFDSAAGGETTRKVAAQTNDTLTFDQPLTAFPTTGVTRVVTFDGVAERVNLNAHGFTTGQPIVFEGGTPPVEINPLVGGVPTTTVYYVSATNLLTNTFELSTTQENAFLGTSFTLTGNGTGTTTVRALGATGGLNGFCVLAGTNAVHTSATMQPPNAVLQNLQFTLDEVSPVYLTGLEYTNWDFTPFASPRALSWDPTVNSVVELAFNVRSKFGRPLVVLELGVSASMISPFAISVAATTTLVGPLHDITNLDYHPSSPAGIYPLLVNAITSMRALIAAEGNTMKVRGIFINLFDNDGQDPQRVLRIGANTVLLRDTLRTLLGDQTIPWIMSGPSAYAGGPGNPYNTSIYRQLFQIAADDPHSGVVDTRFGYTYAEDFAHFSAFSQVKLAQDYFRVWEPIIDDLLGKPPVVDIAICNRALTVIGESPNITSIDPPLGSAHAPLCALLFADAVRIVADSRHWTFADRRVVLAKVQLQSPVADATTNRITTVTPHGLVIGSPVSLALQANGTGTLPAPLVVSQVYYVSAVFGPFQFSLTSTVGGYGTTIDLTSVGSIGAAGNGEWRVFKESDRDGAAFMYALPVDCRTERNLVPAGAPDDWPGMDGALLGTPYAGIGVVATSRNGLNYSVDSGGFGAIRPIPCKRALSRGGDQVIYTDLEAAELVYSKILDDTTIWPPLFQEAVVFQLGAGLGGAIKRDPKLVDWCLGRAQAFISEAARVDGHRVVERERSRYPWAR